ncbi:MAG: hypothetical protein ABMA14_21480 [Hyphomonadaceae bacterium]
MTDALVHRLAFDAELAQPGERFRTDTITNIARPHVIDEVSGWMREIPRHMARNTRRDGRYDGFVLDKTCKIRFDAGAGSLRRLEKKETISPAQDHCHPRPAGINGAPSC